jgi:hypothetical protein
MLLVHARMTGSVRALKAAARYANASRSADIACQAVRGANYRA